MTEYELLYLIVERRNEVMSLIQWWGAVSIGVIAASHFIDRTFNLFLITLIAFFYGFFSIFVIRMVDTLYDQLLMAFTDLAIYAENAESVSKQTEIMLQVLSSGRLSISSTFLALVLCGLTIASVSYPIWRYWKYYRYSTFNT
ncbi:hypothetical protein [Nitrosomonas sp.]|uniref:hypothetical protein n=1 Tax=Nitrosomonas sp. TaxID=42353 RepID=UPI0025EB84D4|nr:hypothetical protein [Nitrosomonas sp.]